MEHAVHGVSGGGKCRITIYPNNVHCEFFKACYLCIHSGRYAGFPRNIVVLDLVVQICDKPAYGRSFNETKQLKTKISK